MSQTRYVIVRRADDWFIEYGEEAFGPYRSQDEAMVFAVEAARLRAQDGDAAEVCLMGDNGCLRPEWMSSDHPETARSA